MGKNTTITAMQPVHNAELEEAVIGGMLIDFNCIEEVTEILSPDCFYMPVNKKIFTAIASLHREMKPVDMLTVSDYLKKNGELESIGGSYHLAELTNRVSSAVNIEYHSRIIFQMHLKREQAKVGIDLYQKAMSDESDAFDSLEEAQKKLFDLSSIGVLSDGLKRVSSIQVECLRQIEAASKSGTGITGIPTGFDTLDKLLLGWQNTDLIILAARPGMGKTSLTLEFARVAAEYGGAAIFSLEMSNTQLVNRMLSQETGITSRSIQKGSLSDSEWQSLQAAVEKFNMLNLHIDDTPALSIHALRSRLRRVVQKNGVKMAFIDYIQLMTGDRMNGGNREQEISTISRGLKALAKELKIPIIALSQLSRAVEIRGGSKRPMLSDLRESGAIEQDADIVGFIYRPEYYGIYEDENGQSLKGKAEVIIAKHRNGSVETVDIGFNNTCTKFFNLHDQNFAGLVAPPQPNGSHYGQQQPEPPTAMRRNTAVLDEDLPF